MLHLFMYSMSMILSGETIPLTLAHKVMYALLFIQEFPYQLSSPAIFPFYLNLPTNAPQNTAKFYKTFLELLFEIIG